MNYANHIIIHKTSSKQVGNINIKVQRQRAEKSFRDHAELNAARQITIPPLCQKMAGTRFSDPGGMRDWFDPTDCEYKILSSHYTNSVINVIFDGQQLIVIAVDTHASQFEFLITKSLMINTCMNWHTQNLALFAQPLEIQTLKSF